MLPIRPLCMTCGGKLARNPLAKEDKIRAAALQVQGVNLVAVGLVALDYLILHSFEGQCAIIDFLPHVPRVLPQVLPLFLLARYQ